MQIYIYLLIIFGILGIIWITKFKINQIDHKKYEQSVEHNYLPVKNLPYCTWNLSKNSIQTKNLEKDPDRLWGREILLDIVDKSGFIYVLVYGTILGSLRHQGFIDHDGDADVKIIAGKYPANNGENRMVKLSNEQKRYLIATKLDKIAKILYPQYIIDVHIGCYSSTPSKIVGIDDIKKYDNKGYACTITIWKDKRGKDLNWPHVLDVELGTVEEARKTFGPRCKCILNGKEFPGFEGCHKHLMENYGPSYMTPKEAMLVNGELPQTNRVYDKYISKKDKKIQSQCTKKKYSLNLEMFIRNVYGNLDRSE
jgi:hypothetical protein